MLCLEDEPTDEPDCFDDNGFVPDVDNVDRYDEYIGAELMFDFMGDDVARGWVIKHAKGEDGQILGKCNSKLILDTRMYAVQLSDGLHCELTANIIWFSKKQNTIDTATFGIELVALCICMESLIALRHKVRTFGVPIPELAYVFCDNKSMVNATSHVVGRLNKKQLSICCHRICETFAQSMGALAKVAGEENITDLFTKVLPSQDRTKHAQKILRHWKVQ
jgi:hypothetical protein